jgi:hypothetical protein
MIILCKVHSAGQKNAQEKLQHIVQSNQTCVMKFLDLRTQVLKLRLTNLYCAKSIFPT